MKQNPRVLTWGLSIAWRWLKGQCHEIFCFWFFSWISFPQASDYTIRAVSNFFENSRRYSQLKVCHWCQRHRWQMEKTFKQKNFNNFVWTPSNSGVNIYINFCLQVHFKVSEAWYCCIICHRCRWHRWQICRRCRWCRWQFATGVVDTGGKFAAGIVDTGGKFATGINNASENGGKVLPPVSLIPVSSIPVVHLDSWISPRIFEKIRKGLNGILWGWGETDSWKKPEAKNLVTLSL